MQHHRTILALIALYIIYQLSKGSSICLHYAGGEKLCVNLQYTKVPGAEAGETSGGEEAKCELDGCDGNVEMNAAAGRCVKACVSETTYDGTCTLGRCAKDCIELFRQPTEVEQRAYGVRAGWGMGRHGKPIATNPVLKQQTDVAIATWPGDAERMYPADERVVSCFQRGRDFRGSIWHCEEYDSSRLVKGGQTSKSPDGVDVMIAEWRKDVEREGPQEVWSWMGMTRSRTPLLKDDHVKLCGDGGGKWMCVDVDSGRLVKRATIWRDGYQTWGSEVVRAK